MKNSKPGVAATLRRVPIFSGLSDTEMKFLTERAVPRQYAPGELLFSEGDACAGLYIVESGQVRIFKSSVGGREQVLAVDGPGSSIAELPVFDGGNYPASAMAVNETTVLFISKQEFHSMCLIHPQVALKVLRVVGKRLRILVGIIEELSFTTVRSRLISLLLRLAREEKESSDRAQLELPSSNQEPAARIGYGSGASFAKSQPAAGGGSDPYGGAAGQYSQPARIASRDRRIGLARVSSLSVTKVIGFLKHPS